MNPNSEWLVDYSQTLTGTSKPLPANTKPLHKNPTQARQVCSKAASRPQPADPAPDSIDDDNPLIQAGEYDLLYLEYSAYKAWGNILKIRLKFRVEGGRYAGVTLFRHYNVKAITEDKRITVGARSQLLKDYYRLFPDTPRIKRLDRFSMRLFRGHVIRGKVTTVIKDWEGEELPHQLRYSKVGSLLKIIK